MSRPTFISGAVISTLPGNLHANYRVLAAILAYGRSLRPSVLIGFSILGCVWAVRDVKAPIMASPNLGRVCVCVSVHVLSCSKAEVVPGSAFSYDSTEEKVCGAIPNTTSNT